MQVLFIVLNRLEKIDRLLEAFNQAGLRGATVVHSVGMAHELANHHEDDLTFASLRSLFSGGREDNRTIFMVLPDHKVDKAREVIRSVMGDLSKPDTGIVFGVPVSFADGISEKDN